MRLLLIPLLAACTFRPATEDRSEWILLALQPGSILEISPADGSAEVFAETDWGVGMYTADVRYDGVPFSSTDTLYKVNHCRSRAKEIETLPAKVQGMAFDRAGRLTGLSRDDDLVVRLDVETGEMRVLQELDFDLGRSGMAYDYDRDILYGLDADSGELFTIDLDTGALDDFQPIDDIRFSYVGMEYNPMGQNLWVSNGDELYEVDPETGTATLIGSHVLADGVNDLALFPPCD